MTRRADWEIEMAESMRTEAWTLTGPNRPVKVVAIKKGGFPAIGGYITLGLFILMKTPDEIEKALGLLPDYLVHGALIYKFARLPNVSEYEYEDTAKLPGGLSYQPPTPGKPDYPEGSEKVKQWRIRTESSIPVDPNCLRLLPGERFPYDWLVG